MLHQPPAQFPAPHVSLVAPIYNEEKNIPIFLGNLLRVLDALGRRFEIIAVDDGSADGSKAELEKAAATRPEIKVVEFRRNAGQTAALMAGIDHASGEIIITIDADLQNDPEDIPKLLAKLEEGFDVVSGWRKDRHDAAIRRNLVSRVANRLISAISGVRLHDYGCTLKAYRREVLAGMRLYGEMHRFVPVYASWMGARVVEVPVRHHRRCFGESKYGLGRALNVVLDLMVVKFFSNYLVKPIYIFGGFGLWLMSASLIVFGYVLYLTLIEGTAMIQTSLPVLSAMLFLLGVSCMLMGLLAEITVRVYFESQGRRAYSVRKLVNFEKEY